MTIHQTERLKKINLTIDGNETSCQLTSWTLDLGEQDGDRIYTYCDDSFIEDADNEPTLDLKYLSDWTEDGISTFLWENKGEVVAFVLDHHPDVAGEHVRWTGNVKIKTAPVGGDVREREMTEVTLQIVGDPAFSRVG
jgi:hypothetical protein